MFFRSSLSSRKAECPSQVSDAIASRSFRCPTGLRIEGSSGFSAKLWLVGRRVLPVLLVAVAAISDSAGDHGLARNALLFALPFAAVAALVRFGGFLDSRERFSGLQALCSGLIVALLVLSCAVRSNAVDGVPPLA